MLSGGSNPVRRFRLVLLILFLGLLITPALPVEGQTSVQTHYLLGRPIPPTGFNRPDFGFPYGWHRRGKSPIHHGIDLPNRRGTSVIAAADGTVFYAGSDKETVFGPQPDFYGNVIVIQHDFSAPEGGTVFTLYGHLNSVDITAGERVTIGQKIGTVGATGIAIGSHLHFEVRIGDPQNYNAVRNPELWYAPLPGRGAILGRVVDVNGNIAMGVRYVISTASNVFPSFTYAEPSIPADPSYGENFAMNDLKAGCYRIRIRGGAGYAYDQPFCLNDSETLFLDVKLTQ
jgi:murein DD-endopeptidase MepM/ murein hydrolase activator NlpD